MQLEGNKGGGSHTWMSSRSQRIVHRKCSARTLVWGEGWVAALLSSGRKAGGEISTTGQEQGDMQD